MNWHQRSNQATAAARSEESPTAILARHTDKAPPINLRALTADLGLRLSYETLPPRISGKLVRDRITRSGFAIIVNENDPSRRQRFTIAHELAHYVLHRDLIGEDIVDDAMYRSSMSDEFERQANSFAAQILLPSATVRGAYRDTKSLAGLSTLFDASSDAIRIRLRELGLAP